MPPVSANVVAAEVTRLKFAWKIPGKGMKAKELENPKFPCFHSFASRLRLIRAS